MKISSCYPEVAIINQPGPEAASGKNDRIFYLFLKSFAQDYPQAGLRLACMGDERLEMDGVLCLPVAERLRSLIPGKPLP